jgi:hypothetical protein
MRAAGGLRQQADFLAGMLMNVVNQLLILGCHGAFMRDRLNGVVP